MNEPNRTTLKLTTPIMQRKGATGESPSKWNAKQRAAITIVLIEMNLPDCGYQADRQFQEKERVKNPIEAIESYPAGLNRTNQES